MSLRWQATCIDAVDPWALGRWWSELLGWPIDEEDSEDDEVYLVPPSGGWPQLAVFRVPEGKSVKNRLHIDLVPDDQAAEVARAEAMGARRVDIGQGSPTWVVLADPDGNEFCILRERA
jgi:hypothetical protein